MIEEKIDKAQEAGGLRTSIIAVNAFMITLGVLIGLVVLFFIQPFQSDQQTVIWASAFYLFLVLFPVVIFIAGALSIRRHARYVDEVFTTLALTGTPYLWNGRQYHGMVYGRQVDAYYNRSPSIDIYIASPVNTRMSVGLLAAIKASRVQGLSPLHIVDPNLAHLFIFTLDEIWGRRVIENLAAREMILRLTADQPGAEFRNLLFQPEAVLFQVIRINHGNLTRENLRSWMNDLLNLVKITESLPTPLITATATPQERKAQLRRNGFKVPAGITCGVIWWFTTIIGLAYILIFLLQRGVL